MKLIFFRIPVAWVEEMYWSLKETLNYAIIALHYA